MDWFSELNIKTEDFISAVEKFPAVWNYSCDEYGNKIRKKIAWEAIITLFCPEFLDKEQTEQNQITLYFHRKWKSLRDCFTREVAKKKQLKGAAKYRKQYLYYEQLSFLQTSGKLTKSSSDTTEEIKEEQISEDEEMPEEEQEKRGPELIEKRRRTRRHMQTPRFKRQIRKHRDKFITSLIERILNQTKGEDDEDKMFMLSLVSELKKVPEDMKLEVKSELINVFKHVKKQWLTTNKDI